MAPPDDHFYGRLKDRALNSYANVQWHTATDSDFIAYRMEVETNLRRINGFKCIQCANVLCTDHYSDIKVKRKAKCT